MGTPSVHPTMAGGDEWKSPPEWGADTAPATKDWSEKNWADSSEPAKGNWGDDLQPSDDWGSSVTDTKSAGAEWA